jgi:hypothetical protein
LFWLLVGSFGFLVWVVFVFAGLAGLAGLFSVVVVSTLLGWLWIAAPMGRGGIDWTAPAGADCLRFTGMVIDERGETKGETRP